MLALMLYFLFKAAYLPDLLLPLHLHLSNSSHLFLKFGDDYE
jgi:hypothetical protein